MLTRFIIIALIRIKSELGYLINIKLTIKDNTRNLLCWFLIVNDMLGQ